MKPYLPYNILTALAAVTVGSILLYQFVLRESFATTLRYSYPEVPQIEVRLEEPGEIFIPEAAPAAAEDDPEPAAQEPEETDFEEDAPLTSVQFPLNLNEATVEELKFIPQVGNVMAQRIVQYREHIGGYTDLAQLKNISGVGDKTYERLWAYFYIGDAYGGFSGETGLDQEQISFLEIPEDREAS